MLLQIAKAAEHFVAEGKAPWGRGFEAIVQGRQGNHVLKSVLRVQNCSFA